MNTVLLLRSEDGSQPYLDALESAGFHAVCVPVVSFTYVGTREMLRELSRPDAYSGLVITSPRTTNAWSREPIATTRLRDWVSKPTYAVGPRTATDARRLGLDPEGQEAGSAHDLAGYIARHRPDGESRPLLFCCGEPRRDELPDRLGEEDIPLEEVVVYCSHTLEAAPMESPPDWVVFFSPRSMEAAREWDWPWEQIRKATVGATTSRAIGEFGWSANATAAYDDVEGLVEGVRDSR